MMKLIIAFHKFVNTRKNDAISHSRQKVHERKLKKRSRKRRRKQNAPNA
jgi:hypothetical protein